MNLIFDSGNRMFVGEMKYDGLLAIEINELRGDTCSYHLSLHECQQLISHLQKQIADARREIQG